MSNLATNFHRRPMVIFIFLNFGMVKCFKTFQTFSNVKLNTFQINIFNVTTLLLFIIYSFIKFKVLESLPKSFHGPLDHDNALQGVTDHQSLIFIKLITFIQKNHINS